MVSHALIWFCTKKLIWIRLIVLVYTSEFLSQMYVVCKNPADQGLKCKNNNNTLQLNNRQT